MNQLILPIVIAATLTACGNPFRVLEYEGKAVTDGENGTDLIDLDLGQVEADIQGCRIDLGDKPIPENVTVIFNGDLCTVRVEGDEDAL